MEEFCLNDTNSFCQYFTGFLFLNPAVLSVIALIGFLIHKRKKTELKHTFFILFAGFSAHTGIVFLLAAFFQIAQDAINDEKYDQYYLFAGWGLLYMTYKTFTEQLED